MKLTPNGASIRPSNPLRKKSGTKLTTIISVELRIGIRTSFEALNITSRLRKRSAKGLRAFCRRRLNTFSTSTMASSTNEPMAIAIPPILMVFTVSPISFSTSSVTSNEIGMVTNDINVVRPFIKKINNTSTTKMPPSTNDFLIFEIEESIKSC